MLETDIPPLAFRQIYHILHESLKYNFPRMVLIFFFWKMYWDQDKYDKNYIYIYIDRKHNLFKCINILTKLEFKIFIL